MKVSPCFALVAVLWALLVAAWFDGSPLVGFAGLAVLVLVVQFGPRFKLGNNSARKSETGKG